jgi:hypothetical protein
MRLIGKLVHSRTIWARPGIKFDIPINATVSTHAMESDSYLPKLVAKITYMTYEGNADTLIFSLHSG